MMFSPSLKLLLCSLLPCLLGVGLLASVADATTVHVDQANGDDARDGASWSAAKQTVVSALIQARQDPDPDLILVAAGTYAENVVIAASGVQLHGGYPPGGGTRDPALHVTILDGGGVAPPLAITADGGTTILSDVAVDGFTLTNGSSYTRSMTTFGGAGVFIEEAAVVLSNNIIRDNIGSIGSLGGGIYIFRSAAGPSILRGNVISGNEVNDGLGGGIGLVDVAPAGSLGAHLVADNQILDNRAVALTDVDPMRDDESNGLGGGVWAWGGAPSFEANHVEGNVAESLTDEGFTGQGGGFFFLNSAPVLSGNVILANDALGANGSFGGTGGGVYILSLSNDESSGAVLAANEISANSARGGAPAGAAPIQ
jgi:hypothetical protein